MAVVIHGIHCTVSQYFAVVQSNKMKKKLHIYVVKLPMHCAVLPIFCQLFSLENKTVKIHYNITINIKMDYYNIGT